MQSTKQNGIAFAKSFLPKNDDAAYINNIQMPLGGRPRGICLFGLQQIVKEADILFDEVRSDYEDINGNVDDLNSAIEVLSAEFDTLREKASESAKAVAQTDSILKYIQNVATQMTLLGFNASIEAKHVGEAGAGFNVIAQEVRQLAEQTSNQTRSIEDVLGSVRSSISAIDKEITLAVGKIETNIATVKSLSSKIAQTSEKIDKISKNQN